MTELPRSRSALTGGGETEDRRGFEDRMRQTHKMEALGRLAGGIAHDFNNILTTIIGFVELNLEKGVNPQDARMNLQEVLRASHSAATLTHQLLAFSRQQELAPRTLDLGEVVTRLGGMLRRLIREDIDLVIRRAPKLRLVSADPGQIEQVIVNLVVNARDAMPSGGHLTVEVSNAEIDAEYVLGHPGSSAGPCVALTVTDSGVGMDERVRLLLFEPFFSTKGLGQGTGLGLATVYGIVKQSGGSIWVYSEPGAGSTFKIYLPAVAGTQPEPLREEPVGVLRGTETILMVEDQDGVRQIARRILASHGYTVLEAEGAEAALAWIQRHGGPIHLLLSDVVLPGLSGRQIAERITAERPEVRVLFMSGHTEDAILRHGVLEPGVTLVEKPFTAAQLLRKVRQVLDATDVKSDTVGS